MRAPVLLCPGRTVAVMSEPIAYFNGRYVPQSQAAVPLYDAGFVLGATVTEQLRTFGGQLFHPAEHWRRLARSLEIIAVDAGVSATEFDAIACRLVEHNLKLDPPGGELGLGVFVTPGPYATLAQDRALGPTVCLYTYPLPFRRWAAAYEEGVATVTSSIRQVPSDCWPAELKCRSRMHYYLADREAARVPGGARAILLDANDCVTETSTANILIYREDEGLIAPPDDAVLRGITLAFVAALASELGIELKRRAIPAGELEMADEMLLVSTPSGILPGVSCNGRQVGTGRPGRVYRELLAAFGESVGVDIAGQARNSLAD